MLLQNSASFSRAKGAGAKQELTAHRLSKAEPAVRAQFLLTLGSEPRRTGRASRQALNVDFALPPRLHL